MAELVQQFPDGRELRHPLTRELSTIGRGANCHMVLADSDVSRVHAEVRLTPQGEYELKDLESKNGSIVNGTRVEQQILKHGDVVCIGRQVMVFENKKAASDSGRVGRPASGRQPRALTRRFAVPKSGRLPMGAPIPGLAGQTIMDVSAVSFVAPSPGTGAASPEMTLAGLARAPSEMGKLRLYLSVMQDVAQSVTSSLDLDQVLAAILDLVFKFVKPDQGFVLFRDEDSGDLVPRIHRDREGPKDLESIAVSHTLLDRALREKVAVLCPDLSADAELQGAASIVQFNFKSACCVPLICKGELMGVLQVHNRVQTGDLDQSGLELLCVVCNMAAIAIENAKLYKNMKLEVAKRTTLSRYFSPQVVEQLMTGQSELGMGGRKAATTILFSDIRGFTAMAEGRDPQQVIAILNEYFEEMVESVFQHGGNIDKFIGDAVMAFFGGLQPDPEDAYHAVQAAMDMEKRLMALHERWLAKGFPTFLIGIGINTGEPVIGNIGSQRRREFTVIGDPVNLASRLCDLARPSGIVLSESTARAVQGRVTLRAARPIPIKGYPEPVPVFIIPKA